MFTGIIEGKARVMRVEARTGLATVTLALPSLLCANLVQGASVAVDGVCLTATSVDSPHVSFDVVAETMARSTLGTLKTGYECNVERSLTFGSEVGGHLVSGHVDGLAEIREIHTSENNYGIVLRVETTLCKYIFRKGYIALNGASLTVASVQSDESKFTVWLIPETLRATNFATKKVGDFVNLEIDRTTQIVVDTTERFLSERISDSHPIKVS